MTLDHAKVEELAAEQYVANGKVVVRKIIESMGLVPDGTIHAQVCEIVDSFNYPRTRKAKTQMQAGRLMTDEKIPLIRNVLMKKDCPTKKSHVLMEAGLTVNGYNTKLVEKVQRDIEAINNGLNTRHGHYSREDIEHMIREYYSQNGYVSVKDIQLELKVTPGGYYHRILSKLVDSLGFPRVKQERTGEYVGLHAPAEPEPYEEAVPTQNKKEEYAKLMAELRQAYAKVDDCKDKIVEHEVTLQKYRERYDEAKNKIEEIEQVIYDLLVE